MSHDSEEDEMRLPGLCPLLLLCLAPLATVGCDEYGKPGRKIARTGPTVTPAGNADGGKGTDAAGSGTAKGGADAGSAGNTGSGKTAGSGSAGTSSSGTNGGSSTTGSAGNTNGSSGTSGSVAGSAGGTTGSTRPGTTGGTGTAQTTCRTIPTRPWYFPYDKAPCRREARVGVVYLEGSLIAAWLTFTPQVQMVSLKTESGNFLKVKLSTGTECWVEKKTVSC